MKYFFRRIKKIIENEIDEHVLLCGKGEDPNRIMNNEILLECKEITKQEAITLCGPDAIN